MDRINLNSLRENTIALLKELQYALAFDLLEKYQPVNEKSKILLGLIHQYKSIREEEIKGILSPIEIIQLKNKLTFNIVSYLDILDEGDFVPSENGRTSNHRQGTVLYTIPSKMQIDTEQKCIIRIAQNQDLLLEDKISGAVYHIKELRRIADRMEVELIDPNEEAVFKIRTISSALQKVEKDDYTEWLFFIKPLMVGTHSLFLKISVVTLEDGERIKKELVLEETIEVKIKNENEQELLATPMKMSGLWLVFDPSIEFDFDNTPKPNSNTETIPKSELTNNIEKLPLLKWAIGASILAISIYFWFFGTPDTNTHLLTQTATESPTEKIPTATLPDNEALNNEIQEEANNENVAAQKPPCPLPFTNLSVRFRAGDGGVFTLDCLGSTMTIPANVFNYTEPNDTIQMDLKLNRLHLKGPGKSRQVQLKSNRKISVLKPINIIIDFTNRTTPYARLDKKKYKTLKEETYNSNFIKSDKDISALLKLDIPTNYLNLFSYELDSTSVELIHPLYKTNSTSKRNFNSSVFSTFQTEAINLFAANVSESVETGLELLEKDKKIPPKVFIHLDKTDSVIIEIPLSGYFKSFLTEKEGFTYFSIKLEPNTHEELKLFESYNWIIDTYSKAEDEIIKEDLKSDKTSHSSIYEQINKLSKKNPGIELPGYKLLLHRISPTAFKITFQIYIKNTAEETIYDFIAIPRSKKTDNPISEKECEAMYAYYTTEVNKFLKIKDKIPKWKNFYFMSPIFRLEDEYCLDNFQWIKSFYEDKDGRHKALLLDLKSKELNNIEHAKQVLKNYLTNCEDEYAGGFVENTTLSMLPRKCLKGTNEVSFKLVKSKVQNFCIGQQRIPDRLPVQ